jgi:hypothetical protein
MAMPSALMVARLMPSSHASVGAATGGGGGGSGALGELQPPANASNKTVQNSKCRTGTRLEPNHICEVIDCTKPSLEALGAYRGKNS